MPETAETAKPPAAPVAHGSPVVMRMLARQRGAGNRAVTRFVFIRGPEGGAEERGVRGRPGAVHQVHVLLAEGDLTS
jgi:hypothetical protein